jgi:hypothetical protein
MKQTKFSEEQIAMALHLAKQTSVEEVTRKLGYCPSHVLPMEIKIWWPITS